MSSYLTQHVEYDNVVDENGNPAGGWANGTGFGVVWQNGPLGRGEDRIEPNGAFVEHVLETVLVRLEFYQTASNGKFRSRENALAITHIEEALHWLNHRTADREFREVEGLNEA